MNLFHFSPQRLSIDLVKIDAILFIAGPRKRSQYSSLLQPNVYEFNMKHLSEMLGGLNGYLTRKSRTIVLGEMTKQNALNYTIYFA
jgi:hypothetical protein